MIYFFISIDVPIFLVSGVMIDIATWVNSTIKLVLCPLWKLQSLVTITVLSLLSCSGKQLRVLVVLSDLVPSTNA